MALDLKRSTSSQHYHHHSIFVNNFRRRNWLLRINNAVNWKVCTATNYSSPIRNRETHHFSVSNRPLACSRGCWSTAWFFPPRFPNVSFQTNVPPAPNKSTNHRQQTRSSLIATLPYLHPPQQHSRYAWGRYLLPSHHNDPWVGNINIQQIIRTTVRVPRIGLCHPYNLRLSNIRILSDLTEERALYSVIGL
jgi:hypothetical protein